MATHQSLSGTNNEAFVQRMVTTYPDRFRDPFWVFFYRSGWLCVTRGLCDGRSRLRTGAVFARSRCALSICHPLRL